jgi:hypothetical protein
MLALTLRIGDFLADESEKGRYEPRLDSDWDIHMWLDAYRLLDPELGEERKGELTVKWCFARPGTAASRSRSSRILNPARDC